MTTTEILDFEQGHAYEALVNNFRNNLTSFKIVFVIRQPL